jgi:hypothetical protein
MNEHDGPLEKRPLVISDLEEKGWQKPVREPMLDARPMGLPQLSPAQAEPQAGAAGGEAAGGDAGAGGGGAQGDGDA